MSTLNRRCAFYTHARTCQAFRRQYFAKSCPIKMNIRLCRHFRKTWNMAPGSFVWTDKESELLLNAVLEYKVNKTQESIDWESCQSKYVDILTLFFEQYPAEISNEFPHVREDITWAILTTKIKAIRSKYRQAVDTGRRSGYGRVVLLYFELCEQIWGGSPATTTMPSGIETNDLDNSIPSPSTSSSSNVEPSEAASDTELESSAPAVKQRRELLEVCIW